MIPDQTEPDWMHDNSKRWGLSHPTARDIARMSAEQFAEALAAGELDRPD
ncbi:hypothetical protein [Microbacterium schleiferi]